MAKSADTSKNPRPRTKKREASAQPQVETVAEDAKLTPKQELFITYYVRCWNAAEAARLAGYSAETAKEIGYENLTKPHIRDAIEARKAELIMSEDEVLIRLGQQARGEHSEYWEFDAYGQPSINFKKLREAGLAHLVKEIEFSEMTGRITKLKFNDTQSALEKMGRYHKMFTDKTEVTGKDGAPLPVAIQFVPYARPNSDNPETDSGL